ncbi:MAG: DNA primase [bacterium]
MAGIISKRTIEEIRARSNVVDVVGSYIQLNRSGAAYKTLCPFHKEKTPSFQVNQERQIFHCFGCGSGGDVFRFVMLYEGVDFVGAARLLATRAGITIEYESGGDKDENDKAALYSLMDQATRFYQDKLYNDPDCEAGRAYLKTRDIPDEFAKEFQIGYAPDKWEEILLWGQKNKHSAAQLEAVGLITQSTKPGANNKYYDRFRGRLMFPIHDSQNRVIGFSGRIINGSSEAAKYVNTPDTVLFHKSQVLYALHRARHELVNKRVAIICEGQIDVLRCHVGGFKNAVAAQGTAFTEQHARIIKRVVESVLLVFDPDKAGQDAAIKASKMFMQAGLASRIVRIPAGDDPDSFIRTKGAVAFQALLDASLSAIEFQVRVMESREDIRSEVGLMRAARAILQTIIETPNAVQRAALIKEAAGLLGLPQAALEQELQHLLRKPAALPAAAPPAPKPPPPKTWPREELQLAEHIIAEPALAGLVGKYLPLDMVTHPHCVAVLRAAVEAANTGQNVMSVILERDDADGTLSQLAAELQMAPVKTISAEFPRETAVKHLILKIISTEYEKRRAAMELEMLAGKGKAADSLRMNHAQFTADLKLLKTWETALPLLEFNQH